MKQHSASETIRRAIKAAGGFSRVARRFNINRASVHGWVQAGVPEDRAPELADLATQGGCDLTCEHLCPDFPWRQACKQIRDFARRHGGDDVSGEEPTHG